MQNQITIFRNPQFGDIRTAGTAEEPMFCATDICSALGLRIQAKLFLITLMKKTAITSS